MGVTANLGFPYPENTDPLANIAAAVQALAASMDTAFANTTGWTAPALAGTWINFAGGHQVAQYKRIGSRVYVRGLVKGGAIPSTVFTLPAGFRPPATMMFNTASSAASASSRIDVQTDGAVVCQGGGNSWLSLNFDFERA